MKHLSLSAKLGTVLLISAMFSAARPALAASDHLSIESLKIAANQLTIDGEFETGSVTVRFGSRSLPIVAKSSTQIVATLNPVPAIGTYRVTVTDGKESATADATITPKILVGKVEADGSYVAGSGYTVVHPFAGRYSVTFPAGTFQVGNPYVFPALLVKSIFGTSNGTPLVANVFYYIIRGDQSGQFDVDFASLDAPFFFTITQTY